MCIATTPNYTNKHSLIASLNLKVHKATSKLSHADSKIKQPKAFKVSKSVSTNEQDTP